MISNIITLNIIAKDLAMTFGSSFAEAFSSFTASSHVESLRMDVTTYEYRKQMVLIEVSLKYLYKMDCAPFGACSHVMFSELFRIIFCYLFLRIFGFILK